MKRPPLLQYNDRAVILSPAGRVDGDIVQDAAAVLESWGLRPEICEHTLCSAGRFSGSVSQRLSDLQNAFDDPEIKLIFCSRGGYGTIHLLDKLDFSMIKKNPKWVIGYSDITVLHAALQTNGIASIHGPMAKHFSDEGADDIVVQYTKRILEGQSVSYLIPTDDNSMLNRTGSVKGQLFGGNLSVFCSLLGSKYATIPHGGILFIEDIGELPYRVDRMIHQLKFARVFEKIAGLIVGRFSDYDEDKSMNAPLLESIHAVIDAYKFPFCFNFPVGHVKMNYPLIMGGYAELVVEKKTVVFKQ